jgi:uncharacterized repeat protein (TIGR02543 family)
VGDTSRVNFRFNGLEDDNGGSSYPVIWNYDGKDPVYGLQYQPYTDLRNRSLLGTGYMYNRTIQGVMSEVIMYDGELDEPSRRKIESYLALKYGVTLTPGTADGKFDYVFSDDGMLWNGTQNNSIWATYYHRIAAVIRDDASNLHNRQSHSTNVGSILHMGIAGTRLGDRADLGDFSSDKVAVIWGDDDEAGVDSVKLGDDGCGDFDEVLNRKWLVHRRTGGKPVSMIVGAQNNTGNQLGTDIDEDMEEMFGRLAEGYSVYMIVAGDPDHLTAENLKNGQYKAVVPMQYIDGEQQCIYTFTDSITYITFGCRKNGGCTGLALFEGTKTFEWTQWTRQNYGSLINIEPGITKPPIDLGDGVEVSSSVFYVNGVIAPANYPSVTSSPVAGSFYIQRQKGGYAESKAIITFEINTPVRPEFSIYDIDGYDGCFEKITVTGYCGADGVLPTLSHGGDPDSSFFRIENNTAIAVVRKDVLPPDKNGQLDISFQGGVTKVVIEYANTGNQQVSFTNNLVISPVRFRPVPPMPPVNEDGLSFVKDVAKREVTTCEPSVEYSFYIGNVNCDSKFVSLRDTLPLGLTWLSGIGTGSLKPVDDSHLKFNSYAGTRYLRIDSLDVPGAGTLRVTATVAIDTSVVKAGDVRDFDNHAWIRYKQIVMDNPVDSILKSIDRETWDPETRFTAIGTQRPDTIRPGITTGVDKYSADSIIAVTVTVNNPNIDPVPMCYLDVRFDANFTYAGGFTSEGVTLPEPVAVSLPGDSLLTVAGNALGTEGFTIPSGESVWKFNLKAPRLDSLAKSPTVDSDSIISPLRIEYIFSTETTDACLLLGMVAMDGTRELPYKALIANDDYVSTLTGIKVVIPVLDNDSIPFACAPEKDITTEPAHGVADFVNDSIRYTSDNDFAGYDTLTYRLVCDDDTSYANVYIYVVERPDNISDAECYTDPPATNFSFNPNPTNIGPRLVDYSPIFVGDLDGDGLPEIVSIGDDNNSDTWTGRSVYVFMGTSRSDIREIKLPNSARVSMAGGAIALGRIKISDARDTSLIFISGTDSYLYAYSLANTSTPVWKSNNTFPNQHPYYPQSARGYANAGSQTLGIADFNSDGYAELYINNSIFDAATGKLLCRATGNEGFSNAHTGNLMSVTTAGDFDNDGKQQLAVGNTVWKVDINRIDDVNMSGNMTEYAKITLPSSYTGAEDGHTQVVDLDLDGKLDVVVSRVMGANTALYVWNPVDKKIIAGAVFPSGYNPGTHWSQGYGKSLPFIGDIDGAPDKRPEILLLADNIRAYKYDGTATLFHFWSLPSDDPSRGTGLTLFDFNQDGKNEIVYRSSQLQIIDGSTSSPQIKSFASAVSNTLTEQPVVADIDNDGSAEILITSQNDASTYNSYIRVFKPLTGKWAPARKVWNQYGYNAVNVNEDLTIPRYPMNPAMVFTGNDGKFGTSDDVRPYNNFLQQQTTLSTKGTPLWLMPDAVADATISSSSAAGGNNVAIRVGIINRGDAALGPPVYVTLYKDFVSLDRKLAGGSEPALMINKGDTGYVTVSLNMDTLSVAKVIVKVNDKESTYIYQPECDSTNNTMEITLFRPTLSNYMAKDAKLLPATTVNNGVYPNPVSILYLDTIEYKISAINANLDSGTVIIRDTLPAYLRYVDDGTADWYNKSLPSRSSFSSGTIIGPPLRDTLVWQFDSLKSQEPVWATFRATPVSGVIASQPMFINRAWITVSDTILIPTGNSTYHQGAGVSTVTFSAPAQGGDIYNATPQVLDYRTSPRSGILVVPDEGYEFAGWSHDDYISLRGERIEARSGIMHYDTLTIYGDVELHADFTPKEYPVRYHLHGGENPAANPPIYTIEAAAITLEAPSKAGDIFTGWTGSNGDEPQPSVVIASGSTGERDYFANYLYSGRDGIEALASTLEDKIWSSGDELYIRTVKAGSVVRVYSPDGQLHRLQTIVAAGETRMKLQRGIYIVTLNNRAGQKVIIEK